MTAEAIGTFALVFAGCGAIMVDAKTHQLGHVGVAITFGLVMPPPSSGLRQTSIGSPASPSATATSPSPSPHVLEVNPVAKLGTPLNGLDDAPLSHLWEVVRREAEVPSNAPRVTHVHLRLFVEHPGRDATHLRTREWVYGGTDYERRQTQ